jgi:hypothetical protein
MGQQKLQWWQQFTTRMQEATHLVQTPGSAEQEHLESCGPLCAAVLQVVASLVAAMNCWLHPQHWPLRSQAGVLPPLVHHPGLPSAHSTHMHSLSTRHVPAQRQCNKPTAFLMFGTQCSVKVMPTQVGLMLPTAAHLLIDPMLLHEVLKPLDVTLQLHPQGSQGGVLGGQLHSRRSHVQRICTLRCCIHSTDSYELIHLAQQSWLLRWQ